MSAGNQQGRSDESPCHYSAGFVDEEGSFHIAIQRNPTVKRVWQVIPELHVSQHGRNKSVLRNDPGHTSMWIPETEPSKKST